jgi:outer membrane immunogenic protein
MKYLIAALAVLSSTQAFAQDAEQGPQPSFENAPEEPGKIGGFRTELQLGFENAQLSESEGSGFNRVEYIDDLYTGAAYGGEIGYDFAVSKTMTVGPYVSYQLSNSKKCEGPINDAGVNISYCLKSKSNMSVGARLAGGTGKGEAFLTLGYDVYDLDFAVDAAVPGRPVSRFESNKNRKGGSVGFGYNHTIKNNIYIGGALHISGYGEFEESGASLIRGQARLNLGVRF